MTSDPKGARPARPQGRTVRLSERRGQLFDGVKMQYITRETLEAAGEFMVVGYRRQRNRRFGTEECCYTVATLETLDRPAEDGGPVLAGEYLLTLEANRYRENVGAVFKSLSAGQVLGPLVLMRQELSGETEDGRPAFAWVFGELNAAGEAEPIQGPDPEPDEAAV